MSTQGFLKPRSIEVEPVATHHAKIVMEPFERGYGHTLGNALRRILLSSMTGYAPTEVQMTGVVHEYSTIPGVREDVVDILLNLKGVVFKLHNRDEVTLVLRKTGAGTVLASDIELPHDVEIINPGHAICNLTDAGKLEMQIKVERAAATCRATCARCRKTAPTPSAASCWTLRSARSVASATPLKAPAWNNAPTWTSWSWTSKPTA